MEVGLSSGSAAAYSNSVGIDAGYKLGIELEFLVPTSALSADSVLLIEPNRTLALQFKELLAKCYSTMPDTVMVDSLQEGLTVLRSRERSLVLMDVELSDGSGGEAVRRLRATAPCSAVITFAPSGNEEPLLEAVQAGSHELLHQVLPSTQALTLAVRSAFIRARSAKVFTEALGASSPPPISPRTVSKLAHDLNNALMSIKGFADILLARLPAEEAPHRCAAQIRDSCDRASLFTRELTRLSTDPLP